MPTEFKDLFVKQRAPKDYVTYPPQETPTLEKFFKERQLEPKPVEAKSDYNMFGSKFLEKDATGKVKGKEVAKPISDELQATADAAPKLDNETLAKAKSIFQMQPETAAVEQPQAAPMQEQAAPQQTPQLTSDLVDTDQIQRQRDELMGPDTTNQDLMVGAIPVLMDLFMNKGRGHGMKVGADYMLGKHASNEKRRDTLEDKLMTMSNARQVASLKSQKGEAGKLYETVGPDGKPRFQTRDQSVGQEPWKKPEDDWKTKETFKAGLKAELEGQKLTAKQKKDIMDREMALADDWSKDEFTKNTMKSADAFKRIAAINPDAANPVEDMGAIFDLMKMLDPQSVVRESEQAMAMGARSYSDVVSNFEQIMTKERKLTGDQVRNIKKFAARLYALRMESQQQLDAGYTKKSKDYGLDPSHVVQKIGSGTPMLWKNTKSKKWDIVVAPQGKEEEYLRIGAQRIK